MTRSVSVASAKAHLSEILEEVRERGSEVIVARRGKPIAVIRAYRAEDERASEMWFDALFGMLSDDVGFEKTMRDVVRSRRHAGSRSVDLGE